MDQYQSVAQAEADPVASARPRLDTHMVRHTGRFSNAAKRRIRILLEQCGVTVDGSGPFDIQVLDERFYARVLLNGSLGLGESYMDGWWDAADLDGFIYQLLRARAGKRVWNWRDIAAYGTALLFNLQTRARSSQVGEQHYDLGNELYAAMLDPRMIYSCGYWHDATTLQAAQEAKLDLVFQKLGLQRGQQVLDIGCGWGGALRFAVERYGVEGVGITISEEQVAYARAHHAGLPIAIRLQDYRDLTGQFDHIYSIGMFEHVGAKNYRSYMRTARRCLKPGGRFLLHTIGTVHGVGRPDPWIDKYIFPNSVLPSQRRIFSAIEGLFLVQGWQCIGPHYDRTLLAWRANFERNWPALSHNRDQRFYRMWRYYLSACAATFRAGTTDVWQVLLAPVGDA